MRICVFLSAADLDDRYTRPAREFAELLGRGGHTLVWGGSDVGLMKVVADGVEEAGGQLCGVSVEFLAHKARPGVDEMVIAKDLAMGVPPRRSGSGGGRSCCWRSPTPW
jgi:predicted Rossmann-fold nucleotide-binding protein